MKASRKRSLLVNPVDTSPNHVQRQRIVKELEESVKTVIHDFQTSPGSFDESVSLPRVRRLVDAIEGVLRHKLLVEPRTGKPQSDPGVIFVGNDEMGLPTERSDMFFRYLDAIVEVAHTEIEGDWSTVIQCRRVALEAEITPTLAELGWGQGRLLLMELMNCGELGRVAKAAGSTQYRPLLWEHYGDEGVLMQGTYRTKALRLLEGLGGVPVRVRHWSPLIYVPPAPRLSMVKGAKQKAPPPPTSILATHCTKVLGKYVSKKKSRAKSLAPSASLVFDGDDYEDDDEADDGGYGREDRSAVLSLADLDLDGDEDEGDTGRSEKQVIESLLAHYGAEQAQEFILRNVPWTESIVVKKQQPFEKEVLTVDGGGVAWQFQVVSSDIDFSAVTRGGQLVRSIERFAEGESSGGTFVPSGTLLTVVLKWNCDFARLRQRKINIRTSPVSSGKLHNANVAGLASRISASWKVVGAIAAEDAAQEEVDHINRGVPEFATDRESGCISLVDPNAEEVKGKPSKRGSAITKQALGLVGLKQKLDQEAMEGGCGLCRKPFSMVFNRPHRCKACNVHFCQNCASLRIPLDGPGSAPHRCCMRCYVRIADEEWEAKMAEAGATQDGASSSNGPTPYELMVVDENFAKYFKMLKMGVLRQAVGIKMKNDEVSDHHVELFLSEGKSSSSTWVKGGTKKDGKEKDGQGKGRKSNAPQLRQVHWDPLEESLALKSVFGTTSALGALVPAHVRVDEQLRLLELFGTAEQVAAALRAKKGKGKGGGAGAGKMVSIIDGRRVNNVSIMLKQFAKVFPPPDAVALKDSPAYGKYFKMLKMHLPEPAVRAKMRAEGVDDTVLDQDPNDPAPRSGPEVPFHTKIIPALLRLDPVLNVERLAALNEMWPLEVEQKRLAGFRGKPEQFEAEGERWMHAVSKSGLPRSNAKVEAALCSASFDDKLSVLLDDVAALSETAVLLMGSDRLRRIFEHLLAIGNALNAGARGEIANAKGFTIDSLLKLSETKSTSIKGTTVMTFFVNMVVNRGEVDLLNFPKEIPGLSEAARRSDSMVVNGDVKSLAQELKKVENEIKIANDDAADLARRKKEAEDERKRIEEEKKKAAALVKAKKLAEEEAKKKKAAEEAAAKLKAKLARSEAIERLAMDSEDEPKKHQGKAIQEALNARAGLADKSEVPLELQPFLNVGEDPFIGVKRLHDDWGGGSGESPLLRSLLRLAALWLSDYEDSLMGDDMMINRTRASAVNLKTDDGILLTGICLKQGRSKSSPFYKRHVVLGEAGILTYHSMPSLELKGAIALKNCKVQPNGRRFYLTSKADRLLQPKKKGEKYDAERTFVFQPVGEPDVAAWCKAIEALRDHLAAVDAEEELEAQELLAVRKSRNPKSAAVSIFGASESSTPWLDDEDNDDDGPPKPLPLKIEDSDGPSAAQAAEAPPNPRSAMLAALNNPKPKAKPAAPTGGGGRSDLLAAIANRGGRGKSSAGSGGENSQEIDGGPMLVERAEFQDRMVKFVAAAKPKFEHLEKKASEMTKRSKGLCTYFGEGGGGSTAHIFAVVQKFCAALNTGIHDYEKRNGSLHLDGIEENGESDSLVAKKSGWRGANTGPTPAQQAWAALLLSVGVGHVVSTYHGAGVVEAVRAADAMCVVRLDPPRWPICYGNAEAFAKAKEKYEKLSAVQHITRAFVSVDTIVTLGRDVYTPFGPGTIRGRAEIPIGHKVSMIDTSLDDMDADDDNIRQSVSVAMSSEELVSNDNDLEEAVVSNEGAIKEDQLTVLTDSLKDVAPRYTVELSWAKAYVVPRDVKLSATQVQPPARKGFPVLTIADLEERARVQKHEAEQALIRQEEAEREAKQKAIEEERKAAALAARKAALEAARYEDDGGDVAMAEGSSGEEEEDISRPWTCSTCFFENSADNYTACEECGKKYKKPKPKRKSKTVNEEEIAEQIAQFDELKKLGMLTDEEYEEAIAQLRPAPSSALDESAIAEQIAQFDELKAMGMLSDAEYEEAVSQLRPAPSSALDESAIAEQIAQFDELKAMGMLSDAEYEEAVSQLRPNNQVINAGKNLSPEEEAREAELEFEKALEAQGAPPSPDNEDEDEDFDQPRQSVVSFNIDNDDDADEDFDQPRGSTINGGPLGGDDDDEDFDQPRESTINGGPLGGDDDDEDFDQPRESTINSGHLGDDDDDEDFDQPRESTINAAFNDSDSDYDEPERQSTFNAAGDDDDDSDYDVPERESEYAPSTASRPSTNFSIFEANPYQPLGIIFNPDTPKSLKVSVVDPICQAYSAGMRDGCEIGCIGGARVYDMAEFSAQWKSFQNSGEPCIIAYLPPKGQQPEIVCSACTFHNPPANNECVMCNQQLIRISEAEATGSTRLSELKKSSDNPNQVGF